MKWQDKAVILSVRKFGESALIISVLSANHGRYGGVIRSAKAARGICQTGNIVEAIWNARLSEHLGMISAEIIEPVASYAMHDRLKLAALVSACNLLDCSLMEREPQQEIFLALLEFLESIEKENWREKYVMLELELLKRLGFGMDLATCAATGSYEDLVYVSPKSGRAVSREPGEKYKDKLLLLPAFIAGKANAPASGADILHGISLTGYFLDKHVFSGDNRAMPPARARFIEMLKGELQITRNVTMQLEACD